MGRDLSAGRLARRNPTGRRTGKCRNVGGQSQGFGGHTIFICHYNWARQDGKLQSRKGTNFEGDDKKTPLSDWRPCESWRSTQCLRVRHDLVGVDLERRQRGTPEARAQRTIDGVASVGHDDASDAGGVVARVEGRVEASAEKEGPVTSSVSTIKRACNAQVEAVKCGAAGEPSPAVVWYDL